MKILYHPDFPKDIQRFEADYQKVSIGLGGRFRREIDEALEAIKSAPEAAGHFLQTGSMVVTEFRRRNLRAFPFFILYGIMNENLIVGALIPRRSDPLTWLTRFG